MISLGIVLLISFALGGIFYWIAILRPYLHAKGITQITAPNWGLSALSDWQMCSDHARENNDKRSRRVARGFTFCLVGEIIGVVLIIVGSIRL
jgi:hypothetical protein